MRTRTWKFYDRGELRMPWGRGPWDDEPDKMQWADSTTGLPCLVRRTHMGNLCGYVGVRPDNRWYEIDTDLDGVMHFNVHGGINFCRMVADEPIRSGLCFDGTDEEVRNIRLFGFDCAHHMDLVPSLNVFTRGDMGGTYRDFPYVREECARLALQLQPPVSAPPPPRIVRTDWTRKRRIRNHDR